MNLIAGTSPVSTTLDYYYRLPTSGAQEEALASFFSAVETSTSASTEDLSNSLFLHPAKKDITRTAREQVRNIENHEMAKEALRVLRIIRNEVTQYELHNFLPAITFVQPEDSSILLEWIFKDLRLGINIEPEIQSSSWFLVSNEMVGNINAFGRLYAGETQLPVIKWLVNFITINPFVINQ